MRHLALTLLLSMTTLAQTLPAPSVVTDPKLISGKNNLEATKLSIEKLYMTRAIGGSSWSPDGKTIAFISDYDGDEMWDVYMVSPTTGEVINLTNTREIAEMAPQWSPDGKKLAWEVKPKTSSTWEIDLFDMAY